MTPTSVADIVGANAKVALAVVGQRARHIVLTPLGGNARVGDVNVAAAQGAALIQNVPTILPPNGADPTDCYDLSHVYVYVPSGTTITVSYFT